MSPTINTKNCLFPLRIRAKLQQDLALSAEASTSEWVTGGPFGSKNAVLVFKTSALLRYGIEDDDIDPQQPTTSSACALKFPPVAGAKPATTAGIRPVAKKSQSLNFELERKRATKSTSDSLSSSSENSISSACDDPTELEADIVKAEKSNSDEENAIRMAESDYRHDAESNKENIENDSVDTYASSSVSEMPASILNITYKFTNTETKLLKRILSSHGLKETDENHNFNLLWTGLHMKPDILRNLLPYQRVNHFPR